jgi:hypothetical protein
VPARGGRRIATPRATAEAFPANVLDPVSATLACSDAAPPALHREDDVVHAFSAEEEASQYLDADVG